MKIVIDISEEYYADIQQYLTDNDGCYSLDSYRLREVIRNGKPLPKGHGRLIDASELHPRDVFITSSSCSFGSEVSVVPMRDIENVKTIIEADR